MGAPHRTKAQREKDLADIADLYVQGYTFRAIAGILGGTKRRDTISHVQVYRDFKEVLAQWQAARLEDVDKYVSIELAKLEKIEEEAWGAWRRSCEDKEQIVEEKGTSGKEAYSKKRNTKEGQSGGAQYLTVLNRCMERRANLLGLDSPAKIDSVATVVWRDPRHEDI